MRVQSLALLALAHGVADATSGWLIARASLTADAASLATAVLLYNGAAFGAQPLFGGAVDRLRQPRFSAAVGLAALALSLPFGALHLIAAVGLAGVGSALFHLG